MAFGALLVLMFEFVVEIIGLGLVFILLPTNILPISVRVGLIVVTFIALLACCGDISALSFDGVTVKNFIMGLFAQSWRGVLWPLDVLLIALTKGVVIGISVSAVGFVVMLAGSWISNIAFGRTVIGDSSLGANMCYDKDTYCHKDTVEAVFTFVFLAMLFNVVGFSNVVYFIGRSMLVLDQYSMAFNDANNAKGIVDIGVSAVKSIGSFSFYCALVLTLPVLVSVLVLDIIAIAGNRYVKYISLSTSLRVPVVVFVMSFTIYTIVSQLGVISNKTIGDFGIERFSRFVSAKH